MNRPLLVMFNGIPGSGKTYFAKRLATEIDAAILNSDAARFQIWGSVADIREAHADPEQRLLCNKVLFGTMDYATKQLLSRGVSVMYDCNANKLEDRAKKYQLAKDVGADAVLVRIRVPYQVSLERVQSRDHSADQRNIPGDRARQVLDRFIDEIEEADASEKVIRLDGEQPFDEQYKSFTQQLMEILGGKVNNTKQAEARNS